MRRKGLITLALTVGLALAGSFSSLAGQEIIEGDKVRYIKDDGTYAIKEWISIEDKVTGDVLHWRYFDENGYGLKNEWLDYYGHYHYFDENGYELEDEWLEYNGQYYYFDGNNSGNMMRNTFIFKNRDGKWDVMYWFASDDSNAELFEQRDREMKENYYDKSTEIYYLGEDGAMLRNQWYNFRDTAKSVSTSFWFYFGEDGKMLRNTTTPDGYTVDDLGRWTVNGVIQK